MIGILVQLIISWLIIWFFQKGNLSVLGLQPTRQRLTTFILFFFLTAMFCSLGVLVKIFFGKMQWQLNPALSIMLILKGIWWNLKSVIFEELIFRGVLLYILIKKLGAAKAIFISAAAFGCYHWFSFGVLGNPVHMLVIFIVTGVMGLLLAYSYAKTWSLYIALGIHLGWNITQIFIFSQGPIGNGVFIPAVGTKFRTDSYLVFFAASFLPILLALSINYLLIRKQKQVIPVNA